VVIGNRDILNRPICPGKKRITVRLLRDARLGVRPTHSTAPKEHRRCTKEGKWAHQRVTGTTDGSEAPLKITTVTSCQCLPPISCRILTSTQNDCPYNRSSALVPNSDTLSSLVLVFHPPPCFVKLFASTFCDRIARIIMAFTIEPAAAAIQVRVYCRRVCAFGLFEVPSRGWTELFLFPISLLRLAAAHLRRDHRPSRLSGGRRPG
jgi:hypothetical protein